jgi:hypothetical protein
MRVPALGPPVPSSNRTTRAAPFAACPQRRDLRARAWFTPHPRHLCRRRGRPRGGGRGARGDAAAARRPGRGPGHIQPGTAGRGGLSARSNGAAAPLSLSLLFLTPIELKEGLISHPVAAFCHKPPTPSLPAKPPPQYLTMADQPADEGAALLAAEKEANSRYQVGRGAARGRAAGVPRLHWLGFFSDRERA